jgi:cation diffusion facilitator CzcD-associated flavoprotein CzcO
MMDYLEKVCECFGLKKYMRFNSKVTGASWNEDSGQWTLKISQTQPDESIKEWEDICDLLLHCTGVLSHPKMPTIPGLDKFEGKLMHTAQWDNSY